MHESGCGTKPPIRNVRYSVAIEGKADMHQGFVNRREIPAKETCVDSCGWRGATSLTRGAI